MRSCPQHVDLLHSQDSPRVPKRRDALSSHPSSSMAPSTLFSCLASLAMCLANLSLLATAEVSTKPWVQKVFWPNGPPVRTLACPVGFSFSCKSICCQYPYPVVPATCADFGANFTKANEGYPPCWGYSTQQQECCECVSSAPPITSLPQSTGIQHVTSKECELADPGRYAPSSCYLANLTCPQGFVLSEPLLGCGSCREGYATRVYVNESGYCIDSVYYYGNGEPSWVCQTCVQEIVGTTTSTTTAPRYGGLDPTCIEGGYRRFERVGWMNKSACRGDHENDNNASHYHVVVAHSLDECKGKCILELPACKGIEYSFGRCEIWTRPAGIFVSKEVPGFTCMRYGWPTEWLMPMNGGSDRACRKSSPTDNQDRYYLVQKARSLEECKAQCSAHGSDCKGIEYSLGRCEIWKYQISATANISGFQCFFYDALPSPSRRLSFASKPSKLEAEPLQILPWTPRPGHSGGVFERRFVASADQRITGLKSAKNLFAPGGNQDSCYSWSLKNQLFIGSPCHLQVKKK